MYVYVFLYKSWKLILFDYVKICLTFEMVAYHK